MSTINTDPFINPNLEYTILKQAMHWVGGTLVLEYVDILRQRLCSETLKILMMFILQAVRAPAQVPEL